MKTQPTEKQQKKVEEVQEQIIRYNNEIIENIYGTDPDNELIIRNMYAILGKFTILSNSIDTEIEGLLYFIKDTAMLVIRVGRPTNTDGWRELRTFVELWCQKVTCLLILPADNRNLNLSQRLKELKDIMWGVTSFDKLVNLLRKFWTW